MNKCFALAALFTLAFLSATVVFMDAKVRNDGAIARDTKRAADALERIALALDPGRLGGFNLPSEAEFDAMQDALSGEDHLVSSGPYTTPSMPEVPCRDEDGVITQPYGACTWETP